MSSNYVKKINGYTIGGDIADGEWHLVDSDLRAIFTSTTFSANASVVYSLDGKIPNDGYDYECIFSCVTNTGTTSGNNAGCRLYSGSTTDGICRDVCRMNTRTSSFRTDKGCVLLPIYHNDLNVLWYNYGGSGTSGSCWFYIYAYRRIGSNKLCSESYKQYLASSSIKQTFFTQETIDLSIKYTTITINTFGDNNLTTPTEIIIDGVTKYATKLTIYNYNIWDEDSIIVAEFSNFKFYDKDDNFIITYSYYNNRNYSGTNSVYSDTSTLNTLVSKTNDNTYVEKINGNQIGGDMFKGDWICPTDSANLAYFDEVTISASGTKTFDISSAIPYDGYSYMLCCDVNVKTGSTSGNLINITVSLDGYSDGEISSVNAEVAQTRTRTSSTSMCSKNCYIPISSTNRTITITNIGTNSGSVSMALRGARRNGNNNSLTLTEPIEKINGYQVGGAFLDDTWVNKYENIVDGTDIKSGAYLKVDLSSYLPNDDYCYEVLISAYTHTGTTSGNLCNLFTKSNYGLSEESQGVYNANSFQTYICRTITRSSSSTITRGSNITPIPKDRLLFLKNGTDYTDYDCEIDLCGYRRIGVNE